MEPAAAERVFPGMNRKRFVLIGAAHAHTPDHLRVAAEEGWRCAALCDPDPDRARRLSDRLSAPALGRDAVLAAGADAVLVCGETADRAAEVGAALDAGLPTFCEKPLGPDAATAERLAAQARDAGVRLDTGYFLRTNPALAALRDRVRGGAVGRVIEARARFAHDGAFADWLDLDGWMTDPRRAAYGGFADEGVHALDWLLWTLGPLEEGRATLAQSCGYAVDDHGVAALRFASGAIGTLSAGWTDFRLRLELELIGETGRAEAREGVARIEPRNGGAPWKAAIAPLDAGEGSRPLLRALAGRDGAPVCAPEEAAAVSRAMDQLYGRDAA